MSGLGFLGVYPGGGGGVPIMRLPMFRDQSWVPPIYGSYQFGMGIFQETGPRGGHLELFDPCPMEQGIDQQVCKEKQLVA